MPCQRSLPWGFNFLQVNKPLGCCDERHNLTRIFDGGADAAAEGIENRSEAIALRRGCSIRSEGTGSLVNPLRCSSPASFILILLKSTPITGLSGFFWSVVTLPPSFSISATTLA